jgi:uncharacterized protein (TIGR03435 family)
VIGTVLCLVAWCLTGASEIGFSQPGQAAGGSPGSLPAFEVASVKPTPKELAGEVFVRKCENGRLTMRKVNLVGIVSWAFDVGLWDVVVPNWAELRPGVPTYDIDATANGPVSQQQCKLMLQRLLVDRFQFVAHHEQRVGLHRVARLTKGGSKLMETAAVEPVTPTMKNDGSRFIYKGTSIADFLAHLNLTGIDGPIYDQTGLHGRYDFILDYAKYMGDSDPEHRLNALDAARIDAMRELGLEVVEVKIPVDTFVVDHAEKIPTEN